MQTYLIDTGPEIRIGEVFSFTGTECNLRERFTYQWIAKVSKCCIVKVYLLTCSILPYPLEDVWLLSWTDYSCGDHCLLLSLVHLYAVCGACYNNEVSWHKYCVDTNTSHLSAHGINPERKIGWCHFYSQGLEDLIFPNFCFFLLILYCISHAKMLIYIYGY